MKINLFEHEPADVRVRCEYCGFEHKLKISPVLDEVLQIDMWAENLSAMIYQGRMPEDVQILNEVTDEEREDRDSNRGE